MTPKLLDGVRVLDLGQYIPGPYAARLFADLGADVIKVEQVGGDPLRAIAGSERIAPEYLIMNGGKRIVEIDLKSAAGRATFDRLLESADVLLESFRPGVLTRLGYDPERLKSLNPRLIHGALSGWGQTGAYRSKPGHDLNYMALGGGIDASGSERTPSFGYPPVADYASGLQTAFTVLAALFGRDRGASTRYLDLSIMEAVLSWQSIGMTEAREARLGRGRSLLNGGAASYRLYETKDGRFISVGIVREEKFWRALCERIKRPDLVNRIDDPLPQHELSEEMARIFRQRELAEWETLFSGSDTCVEPVRTIAEIPSHEHIRQRQLVDIKPGDASTSHYDIRFPAWFDGTPPSARGCPLFELDPGAIEWCEVSDTDGRVSG